MKAYASLGEVIFVEVLSGYKPESFKIPAYVVDVEKRKSTDSVTYILYAQNRLIKTVCAPYKYETPMSVKLLSDYVVITEGDEKIEEYLKRRAEL